MQWMDCFAESLSIAAHDAGNPIVSNGSQQSIGRETNNRVFRCGTFHRSSRTSAMELTDIAQYQRTALANDRKNNRVKGRELPKRIKTVDQRGCAYWFQFILKWDINVAFYIELGQQSDHAFLSVQYSCVVVSVFLLWRES